MRRCYPPMRSCISTGVREQCARSFMPCNSPGEATSRRVHGVQLAHESDAPVRPSNPIRQLERRLARAGRTQCLHVSNATTSCDPTNGSIHLFDRDHSPYGRSVDEQRLGLVQRWDKDEATLLIDRSFHFAPGHQLEPFAHLLREHELAAAAHGHREHDDRVNGASYFSRSGPETEPPEVSLPALAPNGAWVRSRGRERGTSGRRATSPASRAAARAPPGSRRNP